jgi:hypothetical protein
LKRVGLVGCVKEKAERPLAARDLYVSALFRGRRLYVEQSCEQWWILSALHGLLHPDEIVAPYNVTLKNESAARRRAWSQGVLQALRSRTVVERGDVVEIHTGADYRDFGLTDGLRAMGVEVVNPTAGMKLGVQLRFYSTKATT